MCSNKTLLADASGRCVGIVGSNFSGRTRLLQSTANDSPLPHIRPCVYIGPEVYTSISSLGTTVRDELDLHLTRSPHREAVSVLLDRWGLSSHLNQNPFTLSGGEQAALVLLCKLGLDPRTLAIDCAFEQLDQDKRAATMAVLDSGDFRNTATLLSDNRFSEAPFCTDVRAINAFDLPQLHSKLPLKPLRGDILQFLPPETSGNLQLCDVTFNYRRSHIAALRSISYDFKPGHIYHLRGGNGAGKSTLARLLCGVLSCQNGKIQYKGRDIHPWKHPGQVVAYHFQNPDVQLFSSTVQGEFNAGIRPATHPVPSDVLEASGFADVLQRHPMDLPFVSRKRLALISVMARDTPWVVVDEPTIGQDDISCSAIASILTSKAKCGAGIILISHSLHLLKLLKHQSITLHEGSLVT